LINFEARRMNPERSVDTLSGLAPLLRVRPELQQLCRFGAQWASDHAVELDRWAPFHFVTKGACVIELSGLGRSIPLSAGDIAVLPHGTGHVVRGLTTPVGVRGPFGIRSRLAGPIDIRTNTDDDPETQLVCGRLRFELAHGNLVLAALPDIILVSTHAGGTGPSRLPMLMCAIEEELAGARPGAEAIATDLASALFVMVVRTYLDREGRDSGLLAMLAHRQVGRAVAAMVNDPARSWTLDELASCANASRASLVRMFRGLAQQSPVAFLTELRLELARRKLSATALPIAAIADEVGYNSESAFSRAFHRRFGVRPGETRAGASPSPLSLSGRAAAR
jgi:AraC family transcriptional activator of mtrCDE